VRERKQLRREKRGERERGKDGEVVIERVK
jgi:hypothetical protein